MKELELIVCHAHLELDCERRSASSAMRTSAFFLWLRLEAAPVEQVGCFSPAGPTHVHQSVTTELTAERASCMGGEAPAVEITEDDGDAVGCSRSSHHHPF